MGLYVLALFQYHSLPQSPETLQFTTFVMWSTINKTFYIFNSLYKLGFSRETDMFLFLYTYLLYIGVYTRRFNIGIPLYDYRGLEIP